MPTIRSEFLQLMRQQEAALGAAWRGLTDQLVTVVLRHADRNGNIPVERWRTLRRELADVIERFVLARPEQAAFRVLAGGTVLPLSTFGGILWDTISQAMRLTVQEQNNILTQQIANELQGQLRRAFLDPFTRLNELPPQEAAALRRYQHPLEAIRGDGLQIAQRLPLAVADTQRRTLALVNVLLSEQQSASAIGDTLRQYYAGEFKRVGMWGVRAGERLLRIARSEPIYAASQASIAAAATNPYVWDVLVRRGRSVPCAQCDGVVAGNPYTVETVPYPGYHSNCLCYLVFQRRNQPRWDFTVDSRWLQTAGAMSPLFIERLLRVD